MKTWMSFLTVVFLSSVITNCAGNQSRQRPVETVDNLPAGWGFFDGKATFPVITSESGKKAFAPTPFPFQASGKLV